MPLVARPRRRPREQHAIKGIRAVSVEILNLSGKYSNCRLKMVIVAPSRFSGLTLSPPISALSGLSGQFSAASSFIYFFMLIAMMI